MRRISSTSIRPAKNFIVMNQSANAVIIQALLGSDPTLCGQYTFPSGLRKISRRPQDNLLADAALSGLKHSSGSLQRQLPRQVLSLKA